MSLRVLLDENLPHKLRLALNRFDAFTVQYMGYGGLKNGELLKQAEEDSFDVFVTGDKTMEYEQDMRGRLIAVVSLSVPHWQFLQPRVETIFDAIVGARPGSFTRVDCGTFSRRRAKPEGPQPS
ncbi:MAG: hypothetical protein WBY44_22975 [Bryobacteraceae bacterium]